MAELERFYDFLEYERRYSIHTVSAYQRDYNGFANLRVAQTPQKRMRKSASSSLHNYMPRVSPPDPSRATSQACAPIFDSANATTRGSPTRRWASKHLKQNENCQRILMSTAPQPYLNQSLNQPGKPNQKEGERQPMIPWCYACLLYTSPSPRDKRQSRMPSSA